MITNLKFVLTKQLIKTENIVLKKQKTHTQKQTKSKK